MTKLSLIKAVSILQFLIEHCSGIFIKLKKKFKKNGVGKSSNKADSPGICLQEIVLHLLNLLCRLKVYIVQTASYYMCLQNISHWARAERAYKGFTKGGGLWGAKNRNRENFLS